MKKVIGELVGTFFLVFIGTGSIIINHLYHGVVTLAGISIITGIVVALMILLFGSWSGAHMNPAVTIALAKKGDVNKQDIFLYLFAQAIGAFLGSFLLKVIFSQSTSLGETLPSVNTYIAFIIEIAITLFLMLVILFASVKANAFTPWIIGLAVAIGIFVAGNYSGGSMNPIRSLSPAVLNYNLKEVWIFLTGPFIGALLAVFIFNRFKK
ncbi:MAG: aquaporin [Bacteroidetes bacterium]|nr:aquaporin [Bacteroidota bacterium]